MRNVFLLLIPLLILGCNKDNDNLEVTEPTETYSIITTNSHMYFGYIPLKYSKNNIIETVVGESYVLEYSINQSDPNIDNYIHKNYDEMEPPNFWINLDGTRYVFQYGDRVKFKKEGVAKWSYTYTRKRGDK